MPKQREEDGNTEATNVLPPSSSEETGVNETHFQLIDTHPRLFWTDALYYKHELVNTRPKATGDERNQ